MWLGSSNLATNGNQVNSPSLGIYAQGWGTTASRSFKTGVVMDVVATQAATPQSTFFIRRYLEGNSANTTLMQITQGGDLTTTGDITASGGQGVFSTVVSSPRLAGGPNVSTCIGGSSFSGSSNAVAYVFGGSATNTKSGGQFYGAAAMMNYNNTSTAAATDLLVTRFEQALGSGTQRLIQAGTNSAANTNSTLGGTFTSLWALDNKGKQYQSGTITAGGTTGAQTINKPTGSVNFAAAAQTLVVTNSLATTSSFIFLTIMTDDATAKSAVISALSAGSFTIKLNAAATAETKVAFWIVDAQ